MHAGGTAHLSHPTDGLLHLLGRHQHQVGQLVNDDDYLGHGVHPLLSLGPLVVGGELPHPGLRKQAVPLHHLRHRPLEGAGGLLGVGHHRDQQMGDAVVSPQLHHLGVHHNQTEFLRGGFIEHTDEQGVNAHRLTRPCGAGNEHVGQLGAVPHDIVAADVLAHGEGHTGLVPAESRGIQHLPNGYRDDNFVGHLNAHHRDFPRHWGNPHAGDPQRQGHIVREVGELIQPYPLFQRHLIPGH